MTDWASLNYVDVEGNGHLPPDLVVTADGPSGAGKTTIVRHLAQMLPSPGSDPFGHKWSVGDRSPLR